jgi:hypothetical protein
VNRDSNESAFGAYVILYARDRAYRLRRGAKPHRLWVRRIFLDVILMACRGLDIGLPGMAHRLREK